MPALKQRPRLFLPKVYAGAMYGVEAASASPNKIGSLAVVVIDVFKSRNNNHNANQFFTTIPRSKNDQDLAAKIFPGRVMQVMRTVCKKPTVEARFQILLGTYAEKHKRGGQWPKWYRDPSKNDNGTIEA